MYRQQLVPTYLTTYKKTNHNNIIYISDYISPYCDLYKEIKVLSIHYYEPKNQALTVQIAISTYPAKYL